jgi:hypothetical protein
MLLRTRDFPRQNEVVAGFMSSGVDCDNDNGIRFAKHFLRSGFHDHVHVFELNALRE